MSNYLWSYERKKYIKRDELDNYPKRFAKRKMDNEKYNSQNYSKDNSAILKRVINKRYNENIKRKHPYKNDNNDYNNNTYDNYNNVDYNNNTYDNYNNIDFKDFSFNAHYHNSNNNESSNSNNDNSDYYNSKYITYNEPNYKDNKYNDLDLTNYKNHFRNKTINLKKYISHNLNDNEDSNNNYDEFLFDYNQGNNEMDKRKDNLTEDKRYYFPDSRGYGKNKTSRRAQKNNIYNFNTYGNYETNPGYNNNRDQDFYLSTDKDQWEDYNSLYRNRKSKDYIPKKNKKYYLDNIYEKGTSTEKRNKRDNFYNYEEKKNFNRSFIINNKNDDDYFNDYNERPRRRRNRSQIKMSYKKKKEYEGKIIKAVDHLSKYFIIYYMNIIQRLFNYIKSCRYKTLNKRSINNNKYKKKPFNSKNVTKIKKNIKPDKKLKTYENYLEKPTKKEIRAQRPLTKEKKMPYQRQNIIIDRIRSNNESLSPDKTTRCEMYRNINELNKKYDDIYNRKNRISYNKNGKDLSFNSENRSFSRNSAEKYREIFENNLNKERERKKILEDRKKKREEDKEKLREKQKIMEKEKIKNKNNLEEKKNANKSLIEQLIIKSEELKKNLEKEIQKKNIKTINKIENGKNKNNRASNLEKEKIRKYKRKNLSENKYKAKDNCEMVVVKKIVTKDKKIYINIKYLNHVLIRKKKKNKNNIRKRKYYDICTNCIICLPAKKANNGFISKKMKKDNNGRELTSIQEENKLDLSEFSDNY
jgi:hypothetical protein